MQVPDYLLSLYLATCGQNGQNLGSDEKEIVLLVYTILEASSGQVLATKQIFVRPDGTFNKDSNIPASTSSDATNSSSSSSSLTSSLSTADKTTEAANKSNNFNATQNIPQNDVDSSFINSNGVVASTQLTENADQMIAKIPIDGKPLKEAIEEFDQYLRSILHNNEKVIENMPLITDGQLPLRQSLHREACVKDITLPAYYNRFCDLRKELLLSKSGDLSRALVPVKDIKKILHLPPNPAMPQSIAEMMTDLNIPSIEDASVDFLTRESQDMISIIQFLINAGHKFYPNETINLALEPGICSIDEEIDGNCIVRARGLPWQSSDQDIAKFFRGLNVAKGGVALCLSPLGRRNGEALIRFVSQEHRDMALKRHKHHIGNRYIEVYRATGEDFLSVAGGASNEALAFLSKGAQVIIRMRGLPYDCTAKQVLDFFTTGENSCNVLDGAEGVLFVKKPDGRATGDAFVLFANEADAPKALARHRESIGQRYIELFRSTTAEVQQVLNRSLDPKTYEVNQQPPLIAQLPTMPLSLLPQHLITSGTAKNCIRLRGLPYEALVEHILHFLDDFAKHIIYQGVHMVINAQGQPSGEAFIQMDTEESARLCAQRKHNQFMVFGKKYRYIEVFQCSGDDMNLVLNGGLQPISNAAASSLHHPHHHHHHHHHAQHAAAHASGKQTPAALLSPGASLIGVPFVPHFTPFGPPQPQRAYITTAGQRTGGGHSPTHHSSAPHPALAAAAAAAAAAAYYQQPVYPVYWPYPSPPVSPTAFFSPTAHTTVTAGGQPPQHLYPLDFIPANFSIATTALNTSGITLQPTTLTGVIISPSKTTTLQNIATTTAIPSTVTAAATTPKQLSLLSPVLPNNKGTKEMPVGGSPTGKGNESVNADIKLNNKLKGKPQQHQQQQQQNKSSNGSSGSPNSLSLLTIETYDGFIKAKTTTAAKQTTTATTKNTGKEALSQNKCLELFIS